MKLSNKIMITMLLAGLITPCAYPMWNKLGNAAKMAWAARLPLIKGPKVPKAPDVPSPFNGFNTPPKTPIMAKYLNTPATDGLIATQPSIWRKYTKKLISSVYTHWTNYWTGKKNTHNEYLKQDFIQKMNNGIVMPEDEYLKFCQMCIEDKDVATVTLMLAIFEAMPHIPTLLQDEVIKHFDTIHPAILGALLKKDATYAAIYTDKILNNCKTGMLGTAPVPQKVATLTKLLRHYYYNETQKQTEGGLPFFERHFAQYHMKQIKWYRDYDYDWDYNYQGREITFIESVIKHAYNNPVDTPPLFFKIHREIMGIKNK
ncbi:MAG: hypothetical protein P4L31_00755 [Candidatus Babeliales bacterium]|nr:hypothetical protein [Candidatus Babeliales bacterium]